MKATAIISVSLVIAALGAGLLFQPEPDSGERSLLWQSFDEGVRLAEKENKKILIDVYTDWCGWCKKMDSEVYTDQQVAETIRNRFIGIKLDAESSKRITFNGSQVTEAEFARGAGVTGYPTTLFLDSKSKPITSLPGYVNAERFRLILAYIGEDHYKTVSFRNYLTRSGKN